jgi:ATP-dependent DNA ligase
MECLHTERLPEGSEWTYEVKLDGLRAQAIRTDKNVQLFSRNSKDLGARFPTIVEALLRALPKDSILDGELVA